MHVNPNLPFLFPVKRGVNHGSGHSERESVCVGGGFFTSNGSGSTLIKMLDLVNESIACC